MIHLLPMSDDFEITLRNDYLFKRLLGSEENKPILQDLLEVVLGIPHEEIEGIELLDKELKKDQISDKTGILDIKVRLKNEADIDVEIQNFWTRAYIERNLFYWSKMYMEGFEEGDSYSHLHKCIAINIVGKGFNLNDLVHSKYVLKEEKTNHKLTSLMELHFLNLEKATKIRNSKDPMINWLKFIDTSDKEVRGMLAKTSPILNILNQKVNVLSLSPEEKKMYESRMKLKSDIATYSEAEFNRGIKEGMREGMREGMKEGISQGIREGSINTARNLIAMGLSIENIAKATGLTNEEIEKL